MQFEVISDRKTSGEKADYDSKNEERKSREILTKTQSIFQGGRINIIIRLKISPVFLYCSQYFFITNVGFNNTIYY